MWSAGCGRHRPIDGRSAPVRMVDTMVYSAKQARLRRLGGGELHHGPAADAVRVPGSAHAGGWHRPTTRRNTQCAPTTAPGGRSRKKTTAGRADGMRAVVDWSARYPVVSLTEEKPARRADPRDLHRPPTIRLLPDRRIEKDVARRRCVPRAVHASSTPLTTARFWTTCRAKG